MKNPDQVTYQPLGEETLLMQWPNRIDDQILQSILQLLKIFEDQPVPGVSDWNSTYTSIAFHFNSEKCSFDVLQRELSRLLLKNTPHQPKKRWTIPVYYDVSVAPDLEAFCQQKNLSKKELLQLHTSAVYRVFFIGFLPGFMYLGGLDERLHLPRKTNPDRSIPAGSVAIGGEQTGIYPVASPGGWHVIGNCPIPLFDPMENPPCFVQPGDELLFAAVEADEFESIKDQVSKKKFDLKPEVVHG